MAGPHHCLRAPRPGPVDQAARLSETIVAFARLCLCGIETAIAFAGEKWVFLLQLLGAEVMPVSTVAVQGRAEASSVSRSPRCHAWCAIFFAMRRSWMPRGALQAAAMGVLRHAKPSSGVSLACRSLGWRHSPPRLVAAEPRVEGVWPPKCRPIGQKDSNNDCCG